jgi:precorrin-6A/cobalt-precorrin-6A reductase
MTVLVLGGTSEARRLAERLVSDGVDLVSSLAGDVSDLRVPVGPTRVGGFGGVAGLVDYLQQEGVHVVVNATHPFAAQITAHAADACARTGVPLVRLLRPSWEGHADAEHWHWVDSLADAAATARALGTRVFLSTGRQTLGDVVDMSDRYVLVRVVDPPEYAVPASWEVLRARGPFTVESEVELMATRAIDVLVTKDSGGTQTAAKLDAAALLGIPVVILRRPSPPSGVEVVSSVEAALDWLDGRSSVRRITRDGGSPRAPRPADRPRPAPSP